MPDGPRSRRGLLRYRFADRTAIVTGAASGIGKELVHGLAARGSSLVLLDRDAERLDGVAAELRRQHPQLRVDTVLVDLADREATERVAARLAADHPDTSLLINNAGVALLGTFDQLSLDEFQWVLDVNFRAVVTLTHALLPVLRRNPGSHLVNMSSVFGLVAPAGQTAYAASKFAVRGFTEALRHELAGDVGVTCVHPGGIKTDIATSARVAAAATSDQLATGRADFTRLLTFPPGKAAAEILAGVERRRARVLIGATARVPDLLARVAPSAHVKVLRAMFDRRRN